MGPGVASECVETKDGLHVWEDHFYPEVVDPETGEVLPDGERGELVLTSLTKEALPVVRYRTRDLTRLLPGTARTMRRMERVTGRSDDMMILRGVNVFPSQVEELLLRVPGLSPHYQLVLTRPGAPRRAHGARRGAPGRGRARSARAGRAAVRAGQAGDRRHRRLRGARARPRCSAPRARRSGWSTCADLAGAQPVERQRDERVLDLLARRARRPAGTTRRGC